MKIKLSKSHLCLLGIAAAMVGVSAFGTTLVALRLDELTKQSDQIVTGRVLDSTSFMSDGRIYTLHRIEVDDALDGSAAPGEIVEIVTPGGHSALFSQKVFGAPELKVGGRYLLFLERRSPDVILTVGMSQGALRVEEDTLTRRPMVRPSLHEARLVRRSGGDSGPLEDAAPWLTETRPLADVVSEIKMILEGAR